jgi:hypothetical protein
MSSERAALTVETNAAVHSEPRNYGTIGNEDDASSTESSDSIGVFRFHVFD